METAKIWVKTKGVGHMVKQSHPVKPKGSCEPGYSCTSIVQVRSQMLAEIRRVKVKQAKATNQTLAAVIVSDESRFLDYSD